MRHATGVLSLFRKGTFHAPCHGGAFIVPKRHLRRCCRGYVGQPSHNRGRARIQSYRVVALRQTDHCERFDLFHEAIEQTQFCQELPGSDFDSFVSLLAEKSLGHNVHHVCVYGLKRESDKVQDGRVVSKLQPGPIYRKHSRRWLGSTERR